MATVQGIIGDFYPFETAGFGYIGPADVTVINVDSVLLVDPRRLKITFDRVPGGAVLFPSAYAITGGGVAIVVASVSADVPAPGEISPRSVFLHFVDAGTDGATYTVTLSGVTGAAGEPMGTASADFVGAAYPVTVPGVRTAADPLSLLATAGGTLHTYEMQAVDPIGPQTDIRHLFMLFFGTDKRVSAEELPEDERNRAYPDRRGWMLDPDMGTRLWAYINKPLSNAWDERIRAIVLDDAGWFVVRGIVKDLDCKVEHDSRGRYVTLTGHYPDEKPFDISVDDLWRDRA